MAWHGLGPSALAIWRSRVLDVRTRLRILLVFLFFGCVAVLHIVTPSIMTVGTFDVSSSISLNVTTMPGNISDFGVASETGSDAFFTLYNLLYQYGINVGLPDGVNGS
jgi:hypothetical protein